MTDLRKAAERLLEALDDGWVQRDDWVAFELRQALAQPEQEHESRITALEIRVAKLEKPMTDHEKQLMAGQRGLLRTAPPSKPWVSLTDDEKLISIWTDGSFNHGVEWAEAKLKEKNA